MTTLKTFMAMSLFIFASASFCEDDEEIQYDCDACIEAQVALCNALGASNCSNSDSSVERTTDRVIEQCENGSAIASSLKQNCRYGELSPSCSDFSCN